MTKKCNKCKRIKNVSKFNRRKQKTSIGYRYICKVCDNKQVLARRKAGGWKNEKKRQGPGSKHSKLSKKNSQKHRDEMSDMYVRSSMTKKFKDLNPEDIPDDLVEIYRANLLLKRKLGLTNFKNKKPT